MKKTYVIPELDIIELASHNSICDVSKPGGSGDSPGQGGMDAPLFPGLITPGDLL